MNEYEHDYSGVVDPSLKKAMEEFEPFAASLKGRGVRLTLLFEGTAELIKRFELNKAECFFLSAEAQKEGIIYTQREERHYQRAFGSSAKVIEPDGLRAYRALVWGYHKAGETMDNAHTLAPALLEARIGLGPDTIAERLNDPIPNSYFERATGRPKKREIEVVVDDSKLENYEGVDPQFKPVIEKFEEEYKPGGQVEYTAGKAKIIVKKALGPNDKKLHDTLSILLRSMPVIKIVGFERREERGDTVFYYDADGLRLIFAIGFIRMNQTTKMNYRTLVEEIRTLFGTHRLANKILDPQGNAYK